MSPLGPSQSVCPELLHRVMVSSGPELQSRTMSGSVAPITTEDHVDPQGLVSPPEIMWMPEGLTASWVIVISRPELLPRAMSGSLVLPKLGSVMMPVAFVVTKGHTDAQSRCHPLWPC